MCVIHCLIDIYPHVCAVFYHPFTIVVPSKSSFFLFDILSDGFRVRLIFVHTFYVFFVVSILLMLRHPYSFYPETSELPARGSLFIDCVRRDQLSSPVCHFSNSTATAYVSVQC